MHLGIQKSALDCGAFLVFARDKQNADAPEFSKTPFLGGKKGLKSSVVYRKRTKLSLILICPYRNVLLMFVC